MNLLEIEAGIPTSSSIDEGYHEEAKSVIYTRNASIALPQRYAVWEDLGRGDDLTIAVYVQVDLRDISHVVGCTC